MIAQIDKDYIKTRPYKLYTRLVSYFLFEGRPLTTKGQWINPFVFFTFGIYKKLPQLKKIQKPIFILGTGRSGTTILGIVLSMHKKVGFLNEPKALWNSVYPYEDIIGSYSYDKAYYELNESNFDDMQRKNAHRIFGAYLFWSFSKRIVDKYPELIFRVPYVLTIFPDAKFLFLIRNGYDTCSSIENWSNTLGKQVAEENHDWWGRDGRKWKLLREQVLKKDVYYSEVWGYLDQIESHTEKAALEWISTMRKGMEMVKKYPMQVKKVYYEKLATHPREELIELQNFCELPNDQVFINYGIKTLSLANSKKTIDLNENIRVLFDQTMKQLGYTTETIDTNS